MAICHFHKPQTEYPFARRRSLFPSKPRLKPYIYSKIPISNSDFDGGDKDLEWPYGGRGPGDVEAVRGKPLVRARSWLAVGVFQKPLRFLVLSHYWAHLGHVKIGDTKEFGGIAERISTGHLGRHRDDGYLLILRGDTV
ncbi:hypothetical protein CXB51_016787 [Gossypium anomalum]|uniref:Uncharacterized protein n=1 Tax=Gossypium anomalum TaxID=47600 RepID=A0A8J6CYZ3_9ROSI|nr:hypothetical protein CXB51_016787 [Gossypium anomalum]